MNKYIAEAVTRLHPDKICDQISDAILDECLKQDPKSRVALETSGGHGIISVTGELTTDAYVDVRKIVEQVLEKPYGVQINIVKQSQDIAAGVDKGGAGDQGIMVGYACDENDQHIPQELFIARDMCQFIYSRYPQDGKTQVTLDEDKKITSIVASFNNVTRSELLTAVQDYLGLYLHRLEHENVTFHINSAGDWSTGGFDADSGVTGRKIVVDAYGPRVPVGGGAFSGKDPTKVDRSAAYMARWIALQLLKQHQAKEVVVKLGYVIGEEEPVMKTAWIKKQDDSIIIASFSYDCRPLAIIDKFNLQRPLYLKTATQGHFGFPEYPWEKYE